MRWVVDYWVNIASSWCGANCFAVSGFYWDYFSVSTRLRTAALIWGGVICCALCLFAVTRTACTHCTACSCLRASGTEWDYVVSYSLYCTLLWCVGGLSCSTVSWPHLGNVTGVKSGEPGVYYVTLFLQFGNRRLLARPGLCRTV